MGNQYSSIIDGKTRMGWGGEGMYVTLRCDKDTLTERMSDGAGVSDDTLVALLLYHRW